MDQEQQTTAEEQPMAGVEQVQPVADAGADAVAEAMAQAVADFDLSTLEGIKAAAEKFPALRDWREEGYGAGLEAGKQRTMRELQRDQASSERVHALAEQTLGRYGIELTEDDRKALTMLTRANADAARAEVLKHIALEAKELAPSESEAEYLARLIESAEGNADEMEKVAGLALNGISAAARKAALESLDPDELLKDDKYRQRIDKIVEERLAEELRAREVESSRLESAPDAPPGSIGSPGMTADRLNAMAPDQRLAYFASLSDEQRKAMWSVVA